MITLALLEVYAGTFSPAGDLAAVVRPTPEVIATAGSITLPPGVVDGATILVVQPLLGMAVQGRVEKDHAQLPGFLFDRRVNHHAVFVITNATKPAIFITPSTIEVGAIRAALPEIPASATLELGVVDLDGDRRADLASTYCVGCATPGQHLIVRTGNTWSVLVPDERRTSR